MPGDIMPAQHMSLATLQSLPSPDRSLARHVRLRNRSMDHNDHSSLASDLLSVASDYSSRASRYWKSHQFDKALSSYQEALDIYRRDAREPENATDFHVLVDKCNAASTLHNMGLVHKRCRRYEQAVCCFQEAEDLYRDCTRAVIPLNGLNLDDEDVGPDVRELCLESMLAETLQSRAGIYAKYKVDISAAIECHEAVVSLLLGLDQSFDEADNGRRIALGSFHEDNGTVVFVKMNDTERGAMLSVSLKNLGDLHVQRGDDQEALTAYEEAMEILRCRSQVLPNDTTVQKKMATILINMAAIYFDRDELRPAMFALRKSMDIRFAVDDDATHPDVLAAMNNMGIVHERRGDLDSALDCYENVLMLRAESLGEDHVDVAQSLRTVAAVMSMQGNWVGSLDLYAESLRIFRLAVTSVDVSFQSDVVDVLCRMASLHLENGEPDDAIRGYQEALKSQREVTGENHTDVAQLYHRVGQAYLEKKSYHAAHQYFLQSLGVFKANGMAAPDPQVCAVLKSIDAVERLQKNQAVEDQSLSDASEDIALVWDPSKEDYIPELSAYPEKGESDSSASITAFSNCSSIPVIDSPTGKAGVPPITSERAMDSVESPGDSGRSLGRAIHVYTNRPNMTVSDISDSNVESSAFTTDRESENDSPNDTASQPLSTVASEAEHDTSGEPTALHDVPVMTTANVTTSFKSHEAVTHSEYGGSVDCVALTEEHEGGSDTPARLPIVDPDSSEFTSEYVAFDNISKGQSSENEDGSDHSNESSRPISRPGHEDDSVTRSELENTGSDISAPRTPRHESKYISDDASEHNASSHSEADENNSEKSNLKPGEKQRRSKFTPHAPNPSLHKQSKTNSPSFVSHKGSKASPRQRFTKALSKRFRRGVQSHPLDALPESGEIAMIDKENESVGEELPVPVRFVPGGSLSGDDSVSQITFIADEYVSRNNHHYSEWWGGVAGEGLEGWFPAAYVKKAVEVAENFLSASSIHGKQRLDQITDISSGRLGIEESDPSAEPHKSMQGVASAAGSSGGTGASDGAREDVRIEERRQSPELSENFPDEVTNTALSGGRTRNFDYLLGNLNVVHCEMTETDSALPFIEVVNTEQVVDDVGAKSNGTLKSNPRKKKLQGIKAPMGDQNILVVDDTQERYGDDTFIPAGLVDVAKMHNTTLLEAFRIQKSELGDHEDVLCSCHMIAERYRRKKDYESALEYYMEAHRIEEAIFGKDHPENAKTLNNIGKILAKRGDFDLAMKNHQQALKLAKDHFDDDAHPLISQTLICIGAVYYKERNSLSTIRSKVDGCSGFIESGMLDSIARAHEECGSYRMAIAFFEEKLQLMDDQKTGDQQEVATTLKSLGTLGCLTGHFLEALDYYDKALTIQQKLGCDQLQLAEARVLTGIVDFHLGQLKKARGKFQEALVMQRGTVGDLHESVATTLYHIGIVQVALFEYDAAMKVFEEALEIQVTLFGMDHQATLLTRLEIAKLHSDQHKVDLALEQLDTVLESQRGIHGVQHPYIAETLHNIGKTQVRKQQLSDALKTYEECFFMREKFLGIDHPLVATTLHSIASVHARNARYEKALRILKNVLSIRQETLGEKHIDVARTLASQGSAHTALGHMPEATACYNRALPLAEKAVGKSHPTVADIHVNMGNLLLRKCQFDEAKKHVQKALDVYKSFHMRDDHPRTVAAMSAMSRIEREELLLV